jgi:hypothetical protein
VGVVCVCEGQGKNDKKTGGVRGGDSHQVVFVKAEWAPKKARPAIVRPRDPRTHPHQRGQLQPRITWAPKGGFPAKGGKAPRIPEGQPRLERHRTAEDLKGVEQQLVKATGLLAKLQVQVNDRSKLKAENARLAKALVKAQEALLVKEADGDSQGALLAQALKDAEEANERADEAEDEVEWLKDSRKAWTKGLLKDCDKAFDEYTNDSDKAKTAYDQETLDIYNSLIGHLNHIVDQHLPTSPVSTPTTSTKRATSPTILDEPGNQGKRAHLA